MVNFGEFLKTWSLQPYSVTRQVKFKRTEIGEICQNWKIQMRYFGWFDFQTMYATGKYCKKEQNDF